MAKFDRTKPFNSLHFLPPKGVDLETKEILKNVNKANIALAELNGLMLSSDLPNKYWLTNPLSVQEARDSSAIENINTTVGNVFREELFPEEQSKETKEVLHYREALLHGLDHVRKEKIIRPSLVESIQAKLEQNNPGVRKFKGSWKDGEFNGTKIQDLVTKEVYYTPPEGEELLRNLLQNWAEFLHDNSIDVDALIKIAICHYQFEAIHPFYDGNGRTGRILMNLSLVLLERLNLPILYLSDFLLKNRSLYYQNLRNVTEKNEWEKWIIFMVNCFEITARQTTNKLLKIQMTFMDTDSEIHSKIHGGNVDLTRAIFDAPFMSIDKVSNILKIHRNTASKYLSQLEKLKILSSFKHKNNKIYVNDRLYKLLS